MPVYGRVSELFSESYKPKRIFRKHLHTPIDVFQASK